MEVIKPTEVPAVKTMLDRINTALKCGKFKICIPEKDSAIISIVKTICQKEWDITSRHDDDLDDTAIVPSGPLYWHFSVKKWFIYNPEYRIIFLYEKTSTDRGYIGWVLIRRV